MSEVLQNEMVEVLRPYVIGDRKAAEVLVGVLSPVVERIAKERAAAELRAVAHRLDDGDEEAIEVALGGAAYVHRVLCDCAHALDGQP
jgi:hypothetical protein